VTLSGKQLLAINGGSSSIKFALFDDDDDPGRILS
jgi:acetate kinase